MKNGLLFTIASELKKVIVPEGKEDVLLKIAGNVACRGFYINGQEYGFQKISETISSRDNRTVRVVIQYMVSEITADTQDNCLMVITMVCDTQIKSFEPEKSEYTGVIKATYRPVAKQDFENYMLVMEVLKSKSVPDDFILHVTSQGKHSNHVRPIVAYFPEEEYLFYSKE